MPSPPAVLELLDAAANRDAPEARDSFWALREPFARFVADQDVVELLIAKLDRLLARPADTLNLAAGMSWRIGSSGRVSLFLRIFFAADYDPEDAPSDRFWATADERTLPLRRYAAKIPGDERFLVDGVHLDGPEAFDLEPGTLLPIRARRDVVIPDAGEDRLVWELCSPPVFDDRWIYDPETLEPAFAMTATRALTQLDYILGLLRDLGDSQAIDVIERFAREHSAHFVRYRATEALCALAPDRAESYLSHMLRDPHPDLRAVAREALEGS